MHAPADPHSIGRTRSEAEVRPEAGKGRKAVEGAGLSAGKLDGAGASVKVERNEEAKRAIRGEMVRSSLGANGGFLVGHGEEEKRKIMSQEVMMSIKGHMTGAAILDDGVKVEGQRARASVASAPKGYITDMKSLLGGEDASFKPARRQIEHRGVTMLEVEVGVPATLDRYGRPWTQKQRQHFNQLQQDTKTANVARHVAEIHRFESHEVEGQRRIRTQGSHPVSAENPMHQPTSVVKVEKASNEIDTLIDPFGALGMCDASRQKGKKADYVKASCAPWESESNVDTAMQSAEVSRELSKSRSSTTTGLFRQRQHVKLENVPAGSYAELEIKKHVSLLPPWEQQSADESSRVSHFLQVSQGLPSRYVSSSVEGLSKFSKGIATFHDGQEPRKLGVEGAPWLSDKSMDVGIPQCEDWNSLSVELTSGKRRQRRSISSIKWDEEAAGKPIEVDGSCIPGSSWMSKHSYDPSSDTEDDVGRPRSRTSTPRRAATSAPSSREATPQRARPDGDLLAWDQESSTVETPRTGKKLFNQRNSWDIDSMTSKGRAPSAFRASTSSLVAPYATD
ncbi:hypothetical protein GUITHDRAFT_114450 [Guillardia theta CCMP2712]|uniref:Uncharacterized protein n=1 Tax=Guillardia theta (strain CCMP2712) TaxID=905079 RepID=L1ITQ5_GUITC|nr:hypothetical protein GUITHDRAFT_114450 [Guillardia theta CCMP2712]EKX39487.1 hypothetical protein GUITHDRAFT_114450 [Guillardia theta CCMP2712]|eukprot:XP_005826467.1 hypothetical protein GUITHDRAFT_114450 [Guillardia theta CCMP2712]